MYALTAFIVTTGRITCKQKLKNITYPHVLSNFQNLICSQMLLITELEELHESARESDIAS
jgi:hypothetical protein